MALYGIRMQNQLPECMYVCTVTCYRFAFVCKTSSLSVVLLRIHATDPLPNSPKNGGRRPFFGCQEGLGGTPQVDLKRDPVPEPMGAVSPAPFLAIFSQNGLQNGGPFFRKFAVRIVLRWLKTIPQAKNLENKGYRKGSRFGISFGTSFGWNLS